jgi:hypothetical protein
MNSIDILTYGTNYDYHVYERFVGSLMATGFTGNIHIIICKHDIEHIHKLQKTYNNILYFVDNSTSRSTHINNHRFFVVEQYLIQNSITSQYIFWCDMRDVLFQKNMNNYVLDSDVDLYGFEEGIKISQDKQCNSIWIKQLDIILNESMYDKISENKVICCGTTLSKLQPFKIYVNSMCTILKTFNIVHPLDQGIHNYMLYLKLKDTINIKLLTNKDNFVNTVGCDVKKLDENQNIVNIDNDISYIVHQYDRFSNDLKVKISNKLKYNFM